MNREEVKNVIIDIVSNTFKVEKSDVNEDANFTEDYGTSSLTMVGLSANIEEETDVMIPLTDLGGLKTVGEVIDYVAEKA